MSGIKTYPKMNETIKDLLGRSDEPFKQYTLQRIVELEQQVEAQQQEIDKLKKLEITYAEMQLFASYCHNDLLAEGNSMEAKWKSFIEKTRERMLDMQEVL